MNDILATLRAEANTPLGHDMAASGLPALQQLLHRAADEIERLNKWADGMTDTVLRERKAADALIKELHAKALRTEELPTYREIGTLNRTRDGQIHFIQKEERMPFELHSFRTIYERDEPQEQR